MGHESMTAGDLPQYFLLHLSSGPLEDAHIYPD